MIDQLIALFEAYGVEKYDENISQTELSEGSKRSLELQGGPMSAAESARFLQNEYSQDAVNIRTWDDLAKVENVISGQFADFVPLLKRVATQ